MSAFISCRCRFVDLLWTSSGGDRRVPEKNVCVIDVDVSGAVCGGTAVMTLTADLC